MLANLIAQAPPVTPTTSFGPAGRYLLHPGAANSAALHRLLHLLGTAAHLVEPVVLGVLAVATVVWLALALLRRGRSVAGAHLVAIAPGPDVDPFGGEAFWNALHGVLRRSRLRALRGRPHVSFELSWSAARLRIGVWVPPSCSPVRVARAAEAAWPSASTEILPASSSMPDGTSLIAGELHPAEPDWFSLRADHSVDPYRHLLGMLGSLRSSDTAVVQVLARPATRRSYRRARMAATALRTGRSTNPAFKFLDFWMTKGVPAPPDLSAHPGRAADLRAIGEKSSALCFEATIHYGIATPETDRDERRRLRSESQGLVAAFALYDARNHLTRRRLRRAETALRTRTFGRAYVLSAQELAALAHLPIDRTVAGLSRAGAHAVAPPPELHAGGKILGHAEVGGHRAIALDVADARQHLHILGATGSGKSTLLTNLVLGDVAAGRGAVVLDPKGDLIDDIINRLPESALGRVVILDPDDKAGGAIAPPAMNVLEADDPYLAVDHLVGIFHRLFEAYWGPRTDDVLRVAALTSLRQPGATLADVPRLLTDPVLRHGLTHGIDDPSIKGFWDAYEKMSLSAQSQMVGPVMNKLRVVLTRPFVKAVLGSSRSSFDLGADVLDGGLLLARLPKGTLGEDSSRLLGSFIVAKVWQTVTARARAGEGARIDAALYLDECQNFLTLPGSIADMLAEARGYRLSVVAAHQHLSQLPRELREALSANARNKVFFNCSPEDARILERHVAPELTEHDLSHLGAHQAAVRLMVGWEEAAAFTMRTEPAPEPTKLSKDIRADARENFGRDTTERELEVLRHRLAGRRGGERSSRQSQPSDRTGEVSRDDRDAERFSSGRSDDRSLGRSIGRPELPGSPAAKRHDSGSVTSAGAQPDSWSE